MDGVSALAEFHKAQKLNFPLLSDPDGSAAAKFGSLMKGRPMSDRKTYVIDPKGVLRHIDEGVKVDSHGDDLAAILKRLQTE